MSFPIIARWAVQSTLRQTSLRNMESDADNMLCQWLSCFPQYIWVSCWITSERWRKRQQPIWRALRWVEFYGKALSGWMPIRAYHVVTELWHQIRLSVWKICWQRQEILTGQKLWSKFWTLCPLKFVRVNQSTSSARIGTLCREFSRFWQLMGCTASLSVDELELGCVDFKVVEQTSVSDDLGSLMTTVSQHHHEGDSRGVSTLWNRICSWVHMGFGRNSCTPVDTDARCIESGKRSNWLVLANMVHLYYKFEFWKENFWNNVFPVSLDTIEYNGVTKTSTSVKRKPGRPRTKRRIRRGSEFLDPEDLPVACSTCGKWGHNNQTCPS